MSHIRDCPILFLAADTVRRWCLTLIFLFGLVKAAVKAFVSIISNKHTASSLWSKTPEDIVPVS